MMEIRGVKTKRKSGLLSRLALTCALAGTGMGSYWFATAHADEKLRRWNHYHEDQVQEVDDRHAEKQRRLYAHLKRMKDVIKEDRVHIRSLEAQLKDAHSLKKDGRYDFSNDLFDPSQNYMEQLLASIYQLKIESVFEVENEDGSKGTMTAGRYASGVFYPGNYLITAHHVVEFDEDYLLDHIQGVSKKEEKVYVRVNKEWHELDPVMINPRYDMAVLQALDDVQMHTCNFTLGKSSELRMGNFLYILGHPAYDIPQLRSGEVSSVQGINLHRPGYIRKHIFMSSNGVNPGDSGHPLIALRDGVPEIVGITQIKALPSRNFERIGGIIGIDHIGRIVKKHLEENPESAHQRLYELWGGG